MRAEVLLKYGKSQQRYLQPRLFRTYKSGVMGPVGSVEQSKDWDDWIAWLAKGSTNLARQVLCQDQLLDARDRSTAGSRSSFPLFILEVLLIDGLGIRRRQLNQHIGSGINRRVELYRWVSVCAIECHFKRGFATVWVEQKEPCTKHVCNMSSLDNFVAVYPVPK